MTYALLIARKFRFQPLGPLPAEGPGSEGVRGRSGKFGAIAEENRKIWPDESTVFMRKRPARSRSRPCDVGGDGGDAGPGDPESEGGEGETLGSQDRWPADRISRLIQLQ